MQTGTPLENGVPPPIISRDHPETNGHPTPPSQLESVVQHQIDNQSQNTSAFEENGVTDLPVSKKRKITAPEAGGVSTPEKRQISPPWKKVAIDGPTSFLEGGRRKSGRTNFVPIELQPHSEGKIRTRGAVQHTAPAVKSKYGGVSPFKSTSTNSPTATSSSTTAKRAQMASKAAKSDGKASALKKIREPSASSDSTRSHKRKTRLIPDSPKEERTSTTPEPVILQRKRGPGRPPSSSKTANSVATSGSSKSHGKSQTTEGNNLTPRRKQQRLNLRINSPTIGIRHPEHVLKRATIEEKINGETVERPKYASFEDWLDKEGRFGLVTGDTDPRVTDVEARREANVRKRIAQAANPDGVLGPGKCSIYKPEGNVEPPRLYAHQDRLIAHARYFQKLMNQERGRHLRAAKECAEKAAAWVKQKEEMEYQEWRRIQPKTAEEIQQEQEQFSRDIRIQLLEDIKRKWLMMDPLVQVRRGERWHREQERLGNEALNEVIEKAKGSLSKRRKRPSEIGSDEDSDAETDISDESDVESQGKDDSNMSSSESENDEDQVSGDDDEGLTQEQLREKYATAPSPALPSSPEVKADDLEMQLDDPNDPTMSSPTAMIEPGTAIPATDGPESNVELEEVDATLMDDSDASTDMMDDSDDGEDESGDDNEEDEDEEDSSDQDEEPSNPLLGFFGKEGLQQKRLVSQEPSQSEPNNEEMSEDEDEEVSLIPDGTQGPTPSQTASEEPQSRHGDIAKPTERRDSPAQDVAENIIRNTAQAVEDATKDASPLVVPETRPLETQSTEHSSAPTELDSRTQDSSLPATPVSAKPISTPVPSLIRGTLREYQHFGLDWLAGLYANRENGILADEMGLGKTIQTIALLAHLAEKYEIWGPHLIVVPTSVMLNWEMEFKKFLPGFKILTYYGTKEERLKKRQGMSIDKDKWNVWITSYQLVVNDQQVFKRKAWHYMILDEAHNIKNFQSVRWQTLLTYNTHSRLLLTGTPLQNNLTELWSLLFFLSPEKASIGDGFFSLDDFNKHFKRAESQVLESGREAMNAQSREMITNLHQILRPHLLRRLKADVEKQMPGKYEHVVYCRLSKRQRYLYDAFMSRAQTREVLASSNTFSIMNALMQLRKVCNHPDLFETRDIKTSFAMPRSAVADFEIKELLVRRRLLQGDPSDIVDLSVVNLVFEANEQFSALDTIQDQRLGAIGSLRTACSRSLRRFNPKMVLDGSSIKGNLEYCKNATREARWVSLIHDSYLTSFHSQKRRLYSHTLEKSLRLNDRLLPQPPEKRAKLSEWFQGLSPSITDMVKTLPERSRSLETTVQKFACTTPKVVATDMTDILLTPSGVAAIHEAKRTSRDDPYHEARVRLSIAFPDKRLLQYDCGKLQRLDTLLRTLQAGGHRALIFTQMTKVLDILEQFLNIHGHRYLRLDGATKVEQRQALTERFNSDNRILAFILSSRSGGIGINLTGADTVIFYDMDWNPAMDKQCQDRCHRIGQTRDVHIYRMVSEHTIEGNILRKANQKRMLDDVVIQEGDFTTDYFNNAKPEAQADADPLMENDAANEAMDRVLGGRGAGRVLEQVEDVEDINAAKQAETEIAQNQDAADFDEKGAGGDASAPRTPGAASETMPPPTALRRGNTDAVERITTIEAAESGLATMSADMMAEGEGLEDVPSCDDYMVRFLEWEQRDMPLLPPEGWKKKKLKGKEHTLRKR